MQYYIEVIQDDKSFFLDTPTDLEGLTRRYRELVQSLGASTGVPKTEFDKNILTYFTSLSRAPGLARYSLGFSIGTYLNEECWQGATLSFLPNGMAPNELKDRKTPPANILPDMEAFFAGLDTTIKPYEDGLLISSNQHNANIVYPEISLRAREGDNSDKLYSITGMYIRPVETTRSYLSSPISEIRAIFSVTKARVKHY